MSKLLVITPGLIKEFTIAFFLVLFAVIVTFPMYYDATNDFDKTMRIMGACFLFFLFFLSLITCTFARSSYEGKKDYYERDY